MSAVTRYTGSLPAELTWGAKRGLNKIEDATLMSLARQKGDALLERQKIDLSIKLAEEGAYGLMELHQLITQLTQGDPGLEMELRAVLETTTASGIGRLLRDYMNR